MPANRSILSLLKLPAARLSRYFCQHARLAVPGSGGIASHTLRQTVGVTVLTAWDGEGDDGPVQLGSGSAAGDCFENHTCVMGASGGQIMPPLQMKKSEGRQGWQSQKFYHIPSMLCLRNIGRAGEAHGLVWQLIVPAGEQAGRIATTPKRHFCISY